MWKVRVVKRKSNEQYETMCNEMAELIPQRVEDSPQIV